MSSDLERQSYRERLGLDDEVFFVDGEGLTGIGSAIVKKGHIKSIATRGVSRLYPWVAIWDDPAVKPSGSCICVSLSPRELFTRDEVKIVALGHLGEIATEDIEQLMAEDGTRIELTVALFGAMAERMTEDSLINDGDPERV